MIAVAMSTVVHTPRDRVWRALVDPAEVIRWDVRILSLEDTSGEGEAVTSRWRYRLGSVPVELVDRRLEVVQGQRLRHAKSIGAFDFEEIYTLTDESRNTRLALRLASSSNSIPVVGGAVDRFDVRKLVTEIVDENLRSIQKWCENHP